MMQTITVDVINDQVMHLLEDLERLDLIRLHEQKNSSDNTNKDLVNRYKGAMKKQPLPDIEAQLKCLRNEWE